MIVALYNVETKEFSEVFRHVPSDSIEVDPQGNGGFFIHFCFKDGDRSISVIHDNCFVFVDDYLIKEGDKCTSEHDQANQLNQYQKPKETPEIQQLKDEMEMLKQELLQLKNNK